MRSCRHSAQSVCARVVLRSFRYLVLGTWYLVLGTEASAFDLLRLTMGPAEALRTDWLRRALEQCALDGCYLACRLKSASVAWHAISIVVPGAQTDTDVTLPGSACRAPSMAPQPRSAMTILSTLPGMAPAPAFGLEWLPCRQHELRVPRGRHQWLAEPSLLAIHATHIASID